MIPMARYHHNAGDEKRLGGAELAEDGMIKLGNLSGTWLLGGELPTNPKWVKYPWFIQWDKWDFHPLTSGVN